MVPVPILSDPFHLFLSINGPLKTVLFTILYSAIVDKE